MTAHDAWCLRWTFWNTETTECYDVYAFQSSQLSTFWGSQQTRQDLGLAMRSENLITTSPKVNDWCGPMHDCVNGPVFFAEGTIHLQQLPGYVGEPWTP